MEGYTLALDFPVRKGLFPFLDELDKIVLEYGDASISPKMPACRKMCSGIATQMHNALWTSLKPIILVANSALYKVTASC